MKVLVEVKKMKLEIVKVNVSQRKLTHITSTEVQEIKINKDYEGLVDALAFLEGHIKENDLEVITAAQGTFFLKSK